MINHTTVRDGQSGVQETNTMFTVAHVFYSRRPKDNPVNIKHTFIIDIITKIILHISHNNPV